MGDLNSDSAETHSLLGQIQAGDRLAFEGLFGRFRPYLQQVIAARLDRRVLARLDASDIIQETQLEAFRRMPEYLARRPMPFRLWLRQTAQERLLLARRRHVQAGCRAVGREAPLPDRSSLLLARSLLGSASTPSKEMGRRELAERVRQALARLPVADQEILLMRAFEGLSNQEIGFILGVDPDTASKRHGRAVLRLHKLLTAAGLTESPP